MGEVSLDTLVGTDSQYPIARRNGIGVRSLGSWCIEPKRPFWQLFTL